MNTEECPALFLDHEVRGADVRDEHALLDETVRVIVFAHLEFADDALVVKDGHRLLRLQVERMACIPGLAQRLEEFVKRTDVVKAITDGG